VNGAASSIIQIIIATIGSGALISAINALVARRKTNAESESIIASTAQSLLRDVNIELKEMRDRLDTVEGQLEEARKRARIAEDEAQKVRHAEFELRMHVGVLERNVNAYRQRVECLTQLLEQAGIEVTPWTPPKGLVDFPPKPPS
jgi:chromosome segregation ATPase